MEDETVPVCLVCEQPGELEAPTGVMPPGLCEECLKEWLNEQREAPQW